MWLMIGFGAATLAVAALSIWNRRKCEACIAAGWIVLVAWASCIAGTLTVGYDMARHINAVVDTACAVACAIVWIRTGKVWPLALMALYMMQETAHLEFAAGPATYARLYRLAFTLNVLNALQLAVVLIGPHIHEGVSVFLRFLGRRRRNGWVVARKTEASK